MASSSPPSPAASAHPAKAPAPPPLPTTRTSDVRDRGVVRHASVHARRWTTQGAVKVEGVVDAGEVELSGPTSIGGAVSADRLRSEGALELAQTVSVTGRLESNGSLRARGAIRAAEVELRGASHLEGDLTVERSLTVAGTLAAANVRAGLVTLDGALEVPGAIEAQVVDLRLRERSRVGTIRASKVRCAVRPPNPVERVLGRQLAVHVLRIEAEAVELEGVDVRFVRSPAIVLGRDAHLTEYEGTIVRRHPSARVGPESRSPPPHGLSR